MSQTQHTRKLYKLNFGHQHQLSYSWHNLKMKQVLKKQYYKCYDSKITGKEFVVKHVSKRLTIYSITFQKNSWINKLSHIIHWFLFLIQQFIENSINCSKNKPLNYHREF